MKEKPILFSGSMVRAIIAGSKTMTRRVVKEAPAEFYTEGSRGAFDLDWDYVWYRDGLPMAAAKNHYGKPGDRLWVRETFLDNALSGYAPVFFYRADSEEKPEDREWRPSIHMPRCASRLTLEITAVRVERLQSITSIDVQQEGIVASPPKHWYHASDGYEQYRNLWDKLNRKRKGGIYAWDKNPFVWVVKFKKLE